jgi:hypothetical protein
LDALALYINLVYFFAAFVTDISEHQTEERNQPQKAKQVEKARGYKTVFVFEQLV